MGDVTESALSRLKSFWPKTTADSVEITLEKKGDRLLVRRIDNGVVIAILPASRPKPGPLDTPSS